MLRLIVTPDLTALSSGVISVTVAIEETDTFLLNRFVEGNIEWGDDSIDQAIAKQAIVLGNQTTAVTYTKEFLPGKYVVKISATNFRMPTPDTDLVVIYVDASQDTSTVSEESDIVTVGPILPRDLGFPNPNQWNFDLGRDLQCTESAIKMLLSISKGERLMDPEFGTDLQRVIFEPDDGKGTVDSLIQQEILLAVEKFAPFVTVQSISVTRVDASRKVNVDIRFISKPKRQTFQVNLNFER
jgi:phage baseplate assembly protein W